MATLAAEQHPGAYEVESSNSRKVFAAGHEAASPRCARLEFLLLLLARACIQHCITKGLADARSTGESGSHVASRSPAPVAAHALPREEDMLSPADVHADMQLDDLMTSICTAVRVGALLAAARVCTAPQWLTSPAVVAGPVW